MRQNAPDAVTSACCFLGAGFLTLGFGRTFSCVCSGFTIFFFLFCGTFGPTFGIAEVDGRVVDGRVVDGRVGLGLGLGLGLGFHWLGLGLVVDGSDDDGSTLTIGSFCWSLLDFYRILKFNRI